MKNKGCSKIHIDSILPHEPVRLRQGKEDYEQTDTISRCEPFCYSMPLTKDYIDRCEMEVVGNIFDNPELLQEESDE